MENDSLNTDLGEFFDFGEASLQEFKDFCVEPAIAGSPQLCPSHGNEGCICHGLLDENFGFNLDDPMPDIAPAAGNDEFSHDFSTYIPRYYKPEHACDYCQSRQLECFFTYEEQSSCSACNALFRPCSFVKPDLWQNKPKDAMDTLSPLKEDTLHTLGSMTGIKQLRSFHGPDVNDNRGRNSGTRFSRATVKILKDWIDEHADHPYPTDEEKEDLKNKTGLKSSQISNWLANARRRGKVRPKRAASPAIRPSATSPMNIPQGKTWDMMNPMDRWKHSPPEHEPAPLSAIVYAASHFSPPEPASNTASYSAKHHDSQSASSGCFSSAIRAQSITSLETGMSAWSSGQLSSNSQHSAWSYSSRNSFGSRHSFGSNSKKEKRRRRRPAPAALHKGNSGPRLFQCTFCTDTFKTKYDWMRHEKSLHLSLEKWICAPLGEVITCSASGQKKCVFCDELDPSAEHLETHNHRACEEKGLEARTFYRKDHLRQHLRLMHGCKMTEAMESWKSESTYISSRCGFCGETFTKWQDRVDHLSKEFRNGAKMKDWKGCRGLEPQVASHVTHSMPPYLIGNEATSPFPFSASNKSSMINHRINLPDLEAIIPTQPGELSGLVSTSNSGGMTSPVYPVNNYPPANNSTDVRATCWEILTVRLGRFAKQQLAAGIFPTDEILQREARQILYADDDPWNQSAADNPEWLTLFKKAHGLVDTPADFNRKDALEDLGVEGRLNLDWDLEYDLNGPNNPGLATAQAIAITAQSLPPTEAFALARPTSALTQQIADAMAQAGSMPGSLPSSLPTATTQPLASNTQPMEPIQLKVMDQERTISPCLTGNCSSNKNYLEELCHLY